MIKIDFSQKLTDLDGRTVNEPIEGKEGEFRPVTLAVLAARALLQADTKDAEKKLSYYKLAQMIHTGGIVELSPEQLVEVRAVISAAYGVLVTGWAFDKLAGNHE